MTPTLEYVTLDVFTRRRFGGNPLAVVFDPQAQLDTPGMQAIAREFNLSETTFVRPPRQAGSDAEVRIFTPGVEMPWAGHPNVGTAWALALKSGPPHGRTWRFDEGAGPVTVRVDTDGDGPLAAWVAAPQALALSAAPSADDLAICVGLAPAEVVGGTGGPAAGPGGEPVAASVGFPFPFLEVADRAVLARARGDAAAMARCLPPLGLDGVVVWCRETVAADRVDGQPVDLSARMFAPLVGVPEDPATGSAIAGLAAWLASRTAGSGAGTPDGPPLRVAQGIEMGRPSLLEARVRDLADGSRQVEVGGSCVPVSHGRIAVGRPD